MHRVTINNTLLLKFTKFKSKCRLYSNQPRIIQSPIQSVQIPDVTVPDLIFENSYIFPDKIAMECAVTGRKYTYEELRIKAVNLSKAIKKKLQLHKGDVVALMLPNIPEFGICLLGLLKGNFIVTTLNPLNTSEEVKRQLLDSGSKAVITTCELYPLAHLSTSTRNLPILTIKTESNDTTPEGSINLQEFTDNALDIEENISTSTNDLAVMPYSSGTTGFPKGVLHTHRSLLANLIQMNTPKLKVLETTTVKHQDIVPAISPFTHMYGLGVILLNGLLNMVKIVTIPKFRPELFIDTFNKYKPTVLHAVPTLISFMTNNEIITQRHLQSLRVIASASAPLSALDEQRFMQKLEKDIQILQGYGTTESGVITSMRKGLKVFGSVGIPVPNTEVKVIPVSNDYIQNKDQRFQGELFIRGPQVMHSYHNRPNETAETIINGWMKTGDLLYYDDNKNFYIIDRLKELIKVKGFQVAPAELEDIIRTYPNITNVAVIGIPHESYGEVPRAYITLRHGTSVNLDDIKQFVANKVSNYKTIKGGIVIVKDLPTNALGKFLRRKLKFDYMQQITTQTS